MSVETEIEDVPTLTQLCAKARAARIACVRLQTSGAMFPTVEGKVVVTEPRVSYVATIYDMAEGKILRWSASFKSSRGTLLPEGVLTGRPSDFPTEQQIKDTIEAHGLVAVEGIWESGL